MENKDKLEDAEEFLRRINEDQLPYLKKLLFETSVELRPIVDDGPFRNPHPSPHQNLRLMKASTPGGYVQVAYENSKVHFRMFYVSDRVNENEATLYSNALRDLEAITYAGLGLDMRGLSRVEQTDAMAELDKQE